CEFFRLLPPLRTQRVGKISQRLRDRGPKSVSLDQHGHKGSHTLQVHSIGEGLPSCDSRYACTLFEINLKQFLGQSGMTDAQLLAQPNNSRIQGEASFQADGKKVQAIGEAEANAVNALVDCPREQKIRQKETESHREYEIHDRVLADKDCYQQNQSRRDGEP